MVYVMQLNSVLFVERVAQGSLSPTLSTEKTKELFESGSSFPSMVLLLAKCTDFISTWNIFFESVYRIIRLSLLNNKHCT